MNAARVSFAKESEWEHSEADPDFEVPGLLAEKDQKLISYLARHNHWSPFAHTSLQFRIKAPIFVARQLVKHQVGGVWNEVSRRYVSDEPEFFFPECWRGAPVNSKQGSSIEIIDVSVKSSLETRREYWWVAESSTQFALETYNRYLSLGVAPEQARMVLPQNTMTEWIWTGSLMFFSRVCKLRLDSHSQQETREVAQMINELIPKEFEHSWEALLA